MGVEHCDLMYRLQRRLAIPFELLVQRPLPETFGDLLRRTSQYAMVRPLWDGVSDPTTDYRDIWAVICTEVSEVISPGRLNITESSPIAEVLSGH